MLLIDTCPAVVPYHILVVSIPCQQIHVGDAASGYDLAISTDTPGHNTLYNVLNLNLGHKFTTYDRNNNSASNNLDLMY